MTRHAPLPLPVLPMAGTQTAPLSRPFRVGGARPCARDGSGTLGTPTDLEMAAVRRVHGLGAARADARLALMRVGPDGRRAIQRVVRAALALAVRDGDAAAEAAFRAALARTV